jgi:hypothetical protein
MAALSEINGLLDTKCAGKRLVSARGTLMEKWIA